MCHLAVSGHGEQLFELVDDQQQLGVVCRHDLLQHTKQSAFVAQQLADHTGAVHPHPQQRALQLLERERAGEHLGLEPDRPALAAPDAGRQACLHCARFARPRRAHERDQSVRVESRHKAFDQIVATEEVVSIGFLKRTQPFVRIPNRRHRWHLHLVRHDSLGAHRLVEGTQEVLDAGVATGRLEGDLEDRRDGLGDVRDRQRRRHLSIHGSWVDPGDQHMRERREISSVTPRRRMAVAAHEEVTQVGVAVIVEHHRRRSDLPMRHPLAVGVGQCATDLVEDAQRLGSRDHLCRQPIGERTAREPSAHLIGAARFAPGVVDEPDVRVLERRDPLRVGHEVRDELGGIGDSGAEHLDCYLAAHRPLVGPIGLDRVASRNYLAQLVAAYG